MPRVSVIMCVYNTNEQYFTEAVKSILDQTFSDFELIIVDDHSSRDLFCDIVFDDQRIKIIRLPSNHGPAYARNQALNIAEGEYIAIMDSDDISLPNRIEKQVAFLDNNKNYVACGTWFKFFGSKNHLVTREIDDSEYYRCCLLFGNVPTILNPSVMLRRDILTEFSIKYDESLTYGEDYKMWMQLTEHGKITNIKEVLLLYRTHPEQLTSKKTKNQKSILDDRNAKKYLISKIDVSFNSKEEANFFNDKLIGHNSPFVYRRVLDKLIEANFASRYLVNDLLEKRVKEQWRSYVLAIRNPFKFLCTILFVAGHRKESLDIKIQQIRKKLLK